MITKFKLYENNKDTYKIYDESGEEFIPETQDSKNIYKIAKELDFKVLTYLGSGGNQFHFLFLYNDVIITFHTGTGDITISDNKYTEKDFKHYNNDADYKNVVEEDFWENNQIIDYAINNKYSETENPFADTDYLVDKIKNWEINKNTEKFNI